MKCKKCSRILVAAAAFVIVIGGVSKASAQCTDSLIVSNVEASPGDRVVVPVYIRTCGLEGVGDLNGVTFACQWDSTFITMTSVDSVGSIYETHVPLGWMPAIFADHFTLGVLQVYIGDGTIPPGRYHLFNMNFDLDDTVPIGNYIIDIADGIEGLTNTLTYQMPVTDVYPELVDGILTVREPVGTIAGAVIGANTTQPLEGAVVIADGNSDTTDINGHYSIDLVANSYDVIASAGGNYYPDTITSVEVAPKETTLVNFALNPKCDSLIALDVKGKIGYDVVVPFYIRTCGLEGVGDLNGVTFCMEYDPTQVEALSIDSVGTILETYPPVEGGWLPYINSDSGWVTLGIVEQWVGDGLIPPGRYHLFNVVFHVNEDADTGTTTTLNIKDGITGLTNTFLYQMPITDVYPALIVGTIDISLVEELGRGGLLAKEFALLQNYPNPFNPKTEIEYAIPKATWVKLEVYNILGERLITLVDEHQQAGYHRVYWCGIDQMDNSVSSGIYLYKLKAGDFVNTKKMVLLK